MNTATLLLFLLGGSPAAGAGTDVVAHWTFDEGSGTVLHDRSGNGNDGKTSGAKWVPNGKGYALEFDGVDDCVDCGAGPALDLRKTLSLVAWVWAEPQRQAGEPGIVGKAYASYVLTQYGEQVWTYASAGGNNAKTSLPFGRWCHLASTYDGETLKLYVDGELRSTNPVATPLASGGHFWMGRSDGDRQFTQDAHFRGKLAEVLAYNRALTAEEISHHASTTNLSGGVAVSAIPVPSQQRLLVEVDKRGLGETAPSLVVRAELLRVAGDGRPAGPALASASSRDFALDRKATLALPMGNARSGTYAVRAAAKTADGKDVGLPGSTQVTWTPLPTFPRGPQGARRLNNLVTEFLHIAGPDGSGKAHAFVNPRRGWVFFSNRGSAEVELVAEATEEPRRVTLDQTHGDAHETMRVLDAGKYTVSAAKVEGLIVRGVPALVFARFDSNPHVSEFGSYQGGFHRKYVFPNVNTFVGLPGEPFAREWQERGGKWLVRCPVPRGTADEPLTVETARTLLVESEALRATHLAGLIADEFGGSDPECAIWAKAVDEVLTLPEYRDKVYDPYAGDLWNGPEGREFVATLVKHGCGIAWERYLKEQRTEADAWRFLNARLVDSAQQYREQCPGSLPHLIVCFGYFSAPPEQLDTFPHVNYKTYLDMQFNLAANHPAFEGLGGLMTYLASYADEETVRWGAKLFRHYGIEGSTKRLGDDPYLLTHLTNGDFERQGEGWTLQPAAEGTIRFDTSPGFGWLQGRYPQTDEGNTVLVTKRSADKPNVFSQEINNLKAGQLYSLRLYSADFKDLSAEQENALSIQLEGVTLVPANCFTHVFANCYSHHFGPYTQEHKGWMNYHWRVFRANGTTAKLTVSDWKSAAEPGGPIGQELMYNFVQMQPYEAP